MIIRYLRMSGLVIVLAACVVSTSGCFLLLGAAAGVGGYAWVSGVLEKEYDVSATKLYQAAVKGLEEMEISIESDQNDRISAKIIGITAKNERVDVDIEAITERRARIKVRVGLLGDQEKSQLIMSTVEQKL